MSISKSQTASNKGSRNKSPNVSNKTSTTTYKFELKVDKSLVKTLFGNTYIQEQANSFKKKMTFTLDPPDEDEGEKEWTFRASGQHRQTVKTFGIIVTKRYHKMVTVVNAIVEKGKVETTA